MNKCRKERTGTVMAIIRFQCAIVLRIVLTLIFFIILTPLALARRVLGHDPMARKQWKRGTESVFVNRDHRFTAEDLGSPK